MYSPFVRFNRSFRPMSPFPTVAPSDRGSPPTGGTMRTLRRLSSRLGLLRLSLVGRYLAVSLLFCAPDGRRETAPPETGRNRCSGSPSLLDRMFQRGVDRPPRFLTQPCVRMPRSQTPAGSMTPPPLGAFKCCLPPICNSVGPWRLYNFSGFNDAACVLATTVLHGNPHGIPRRIRYRPAGGR